MSTENEAGSLGQSFDEFLKEQGEYDSATERAVKRVIAYQLTEVVREQKVTKAELARRLETSRSQINRLLDLENEG